MSQLSWNHRLASPALDCPSMINPFPLFLRESILKTAKALVEDTKTLVTGAASTQEQLAKAAQSAVGTITRLADVVKLGAATLGGDDPDGQVGTHCHNLSTLL